MKEVGKVLCKNCRSELKGKYCQQCGQKEILAEDKKLKHFFEEFISSLFVADGKVLVTFKYLLTKPGTLTKAYNDGATQKYLSPLRLFFFANLIYFLFPVLNTFSTDLNMQLNYQSYSAYTKEVVQSYLLAEGVAYEVYRNSFEQLSSNLGKALLIILVIFQAIIFKLFFIRKKDLFFIDFLAAASYFISFYILIYLVVFPLIITGIEHVFHLNLWAFFDDRILTTVYNISSIVYLTVMLRRAFSVSKAKSVAGAVLSTLFLVPTFIAYRFILFVVTHFIIT